MLLVSPQPVVPPQSPDESLFPVQPLTDGVLLVPQQPVFLVPLQVPGGGWDGVLLVLQQPVLVVLQASDESLFLLQLLGDEGVLLVPQQPEFVVLHSSDESMGLSQQVLSVVVAQQASFPGRLLSFSFSPRHEVGVDFISGDTLRLSITSTPSSSALLQVLDVPQHDRCIGNWLPELVG